MLPLDKNTALFHIDSIKRSNCQILSKILNNHWSPAAFDQRGLDNQIIHHLIKGLQCLIRTTLLKEWTPTNVGMSQIM